MTTEMTPEDLDRYSEQHQGQYDVQKGATRLYGWRCFLLDESELRRLAILETNTRDSLFFSKHVRLVSQLTGIPSESIECTNIQGKILSIIPNNEV
ncbi:MAG: hypothetical protein PHQ59_03765 [Candidatus Daviesbacteria bacterium]|nr:hypothetical protein [Candidatus Daviesbacteria bacterium]